ncbi:MAG: iron-sulfur cluster assembly scaffold protein [Glaciimonas sp.]|nr:iron-sulfur cluster assembly scaffold protein [Glaciimonas sp.]
MEDLYNRTIRKLAEQASGAGRLARVDVSVMRDSPLCGDRVTLDLVMHVGRVAKVGHEVNGCILCQASAAVIGLHATGKSGDEIRQAAAELKTMLKNAGPVPSGWAELACFAPVGGHASRHGCVLLPFEALVAALG